MGTPLRVLIVEDSEDDLTLLLRELRRSGYEVTFERVENAVEMTTALERQQWDVILSDFSMPNFSATAALKLLQQKELDIPFIIVSGTVGEEAAVAALKAGAHDFFSKQKLTLLAPAIEREMREADERRKRRWTEEELRQSDERFRLLLESAPEAIIIVDQEGRILLTNAHTETIFGYTSEELNGQSIESLMPTRFRDIHPVYRTDYMAYRSPRPMGVGRELWGLRKDGSEFPVEVGLSAIETPAGMMVAAFLADISPRRKIEEQLRYQSLLLSNVSDAVMSTDMAFRIRSWNRGAELVYGWKAEEVVDQAGIEILQTEYSRGSEEEALQHLMEHEEWQGEVMQRRKDGSPVYIMSSVSFVTDASGERIGVVAVNRDITERKQTEAALEATERRFSAVVEKSFDGVLLVSPEGQMLYVSPAVTRILGYSVEEFAALNRSELIHPDDLPGAAVQIPESVQSPGVPFTIELRFRHKDGSWRWVERTVRNLLDEPDVEAVVVNFHDITERKQAEEALRESEERYRNITEVISDYAFSYRVDPDQSISREWITGESFTRITGFAIEEVESSGTFSLYHPEDSELAREHLNKVFQGQAVRGEYRIITKGGELRWLDVYRQPVWDQRQNRVVRYYGIAQDITEQKRIEQEKLEAERIRTELESEKELLKLKERFISIVSHEFRTPLSVIMSSGELVQRYYDRMSPEKQLDHIREIILQSGYMTGLLDDILTFNKASAGKLEFKPAPLDVKAFCRSAIERIESTDKGKHPFHFITEGYLENTVLDQKLLQHILVNLLSNAVKYSPQDSEVRLEVSRQTHEIVFRISDQGIGIPPQAQARLFEPFHRADNVGNISGTGLGLAIVKESVDLHRGTIKCESVLGVGTTFTVYLPAFMRTPNNRDNA